MLLPDVRPPHVVARAALIAVLATVAVPGVAGSQNPSREETIADSAFADLALDPQLGTPTSTYSLDQERQSAANLTADSALSEPSLAQPPADRTLGAIPAAPVIARGTWRFDPELSWYGPGFYGQHTACGQTLTTSLLGVAHRTLPCGTLVSFKNPVNGRVITVPVVDRGPYVYGRQWDLTYATCSAIGHCWTGSIYWRFG
jgi:hypothetical protein